MTTSGFCEVFALSRYTRGLLLMIRLKTGKSLRTVSTSNAILSTVLLRKDQALSHKDGVCTFIDYLNAKNRSWFWLFCKLLVYIYFPDTAL